MKQKKLFERGSEWRKWDLHVHAPGTKLNDNFSNNWDDYLKKMANSDIDVFGITDYFSFDCFNNLHNKIDELRNKINNSDESKMLYEKIIKKVFFPNLELRLIETDKNNNNVNLHIIFNNEMQDRNKKLSFFLEKLRLNKQSGKFCDNEVNYEIDYTTIDDIIQALKDSNITKNDYLIVSAINGYGSVRNFENTKNRTSETLKPIRDFSDLFFGVKNNFNFNIKEYNKPTIFCSDAHCIDDLCAYNNEISKGYTWIKADPTFEGLKQILYEPEERVRIQEEKPDYKNDYDIIDSIIIKNKNDIPYDKKVVCDEGIELKFNQNLNSIIGEKSSGKSFLLHLLVKKLNEQEYNKRGESGKYKNIEELIDFDVKYRTKNNTGINRNDIILHKIKYIPQNYLNKNITNEIEKIQNDIIDIIKNKESIKCNFLEIEKNYNEIMERNNIEIITNIQKYFSDKRLLGLLQNEKINIGTNEEELSKQIFSNNEQISLLLLKNIDESQLSRYNTCKKNISDKSATLDLYKKIIFDLKNLNVGEYFKEAEVHFINKLQNIGSGNLAGEFITIYENFIKDIENKKDNEIVNITQRKNLIEEEIENDKEIILPIQKIIEENIEQNNKKPF